MKYVFALLLIACFWVPGVRAQTRSPLQRDSVEVKKDVKGVKTVVVDTTRKEKVRSIGQEMREDLKKEEQGVKNKVPGTGQVKRSNEAVKGMPQKERDELRESVKKEVSKEGLRKTATESVSTTGAGDVRQVGSDVKREEAGAKTAVKSEAADVKKQLLHPVDTTKLSKQQAGKLLESKAENLQYSSEDPGNAPWKKEQFSKDDLSDLGLPGGAPGSPAVPGDPSSRYKDKIGAIQGPAFSEDAVKGKMSAKSAGESLKNNSAGHLLDSVLSVRDDLAAGSIKEQLLGAKKVYSDKYRKRIYDSLGVSKADSLFNVASGFAKKETSKDDLMSRLNSTINGKDAKGVGMDEENQSLKLDDADKLGGFQNQLTKGDTTGLGVGDLSDFKLPQDVLAKLSPLRGSVLDSKYMPYIDSMRRIALKDKKLLLQEDSITENIKRTAFKKKPSFLDKLYFEGLLNFSSDSTVDIIKVSPTLGYHFTEALSIGAGPNLLFQVQERKLNFMAGFRTFVKAEVWKQRAYLQLEDNIDQFKINREALHKTTHAVLGGGGVLLPISKSLAINVAVLYRLNKDVNSPGHSPWVFRIGMSSIKNKTSNR